MPTLKDLHQRRDRHRAHERERRRLRLGIREGEVMEREEPMAEGGEAGDEAARKETGHD
jgi:hypothetical protein